MEINIIKIEIVNRNINKVVINGKMSRVWLTLAHYGRENVKMREKTNKIFITFDNSRVSVFIFHISVSCRFYRQGMLLIIIWKKVCFYRDTVFFVEQWKLFEIEIRLDSALWFMIYDFDLWFWFTIWSMIYENIHDSDLDLWFMIWIFYLLFWFITVTFSFYLQFMITILLLSPNYHQHNHH